MKYLQIDLDISNNIVTKPTKINFGNDVIGKLDDPTIIIDTIIFDTFVSKISSYTQYSIHYIDNISFVILKIIINFELWKYYSATGVIYL